MRAKILLLDIETAPKKGFIWDVWKQNIPNAMLVSHGYVLCVCAKWLGDNKVMSVSLKDDPNYKPGTEDDSFVVEKALEWMNEADMIIAHNGDNFDIPVLNTRILFNRLEPPIPYSTVDTFKIAKKKFKFTHNGLDPIAEFLGVGRKVKHDGFEMWADCMTGGESAWKNMVSYCKGDVELLEKVYIELRPWATSHPNVSLYEDDEKIHCNVCSSTNLTEVRRFYTTKVMKYKMYRCECGAWIRERINCSSKAKKRVTMTMCQ